MEQDQFYSSIATYYDDIFPVSNEQLEFIRSEFNTLDELFFLDAGCSTGQLAYQLSRLGAMGVGIDLNQKMIEQAAALRASVGVSFRHMNMLRLEATLPPAYFDAVICFGNTLVHLDSVTQIRNFLQQCVRVLKRGGKLFLQLLNYQHILANEIGQLPLIENEFVRFERSYHLPDSNHPKIQFDTVLAVKHDDVELRNSTMLLPLRKNELERLLLLVGFKQLRFYAGFNKSPFSGDHIPLVVVAEL